MTAILAAVYTASYLSRFSYTIVLPEMVASTGKSKGELSVVVTILFVCYGIGQIISGVLADRLPSKALIFSGLFVSSCLNFAVPFIDSTPLTALIWGLNGFSQSLMWPTIVGVMSGAFSKDDYLRGSEMVSLGGYFGSILLYLLSPLLIGTMSWKAVFFMSGIAGIAMATVFALFFPDVPAAKKRLAAEKTDLGKAASIISPALICILICIVIQAFIREGVTTWMPVYVSEMFDIGPVLSILIGVILPVSAIVCNRLTTIVNRRLIANPLTLVAVLLALGTAIASLLFFVNGSAAILTVILSALLAGFLYGVNLMLLCMIPPRFKSSGNVSAVSGLLNATACAGSAAAGYGLAALSESFEWRWIFLMLAGGVAVAGLIAFGTRRSKLGGN